MELRAQVNDVINQINTGKAFAFGIFALYISLLSIMATVVLGLMPLLYR